MSTSGSFFRVRSTRARAPARGTGWRRVLVVTGVLLGMLSVAGPALANHEVQWSAGSDCGAGVSAVEAVGPVEFSVCVALGGSPLTGFPMFVEVTQEDGTTSEMLLTTDGEGRASFNVVKSQDRSSPPILIRLCDADGCGNGEAIVTAPPPPTTTTSTTTTTTTSTTTTSTTTTSTTTTSTTTTSTTTTTTTMPPEPNVTTTETTAFVAQPVVDESGDFPWAAVLIGPGALLILIGGFLMTRSEDEDPCAKLYELWQRAEGRARLAEQSLAEARVYLEERKGRVAELEAELASLQASARSSLTEGGTKYHLIDGGRVTLEGLAEITESVQASLEHARSAEESAAQSVRDWEQRVREYREAAAEAKAAYERCTGVFTSSEGTETDQGTSDERGGDEEGSSGGETLATGPTIVDEPSTATGEEPENTCTDGTRKEEEAGDADSITTIVDFALIVEVEPESKRRVEAAEAMAFDLRRLYGELDLAGTMLGAAGAGSSLAGGVGGMRAGEYVTGAGGLIEGTVSGTLAGTGAHVGSGDMEISIPTSPQEAVTELLEATARLGALVASKVGTWLKMNQLYRVRLRFFTQTMTATPYEIKECRDNEWVCVERVYQISIGKLRRGPQPNPKSFKLESDASRRAFERQIATLARRAKQEIDKGAQRRKKFEDDHQSGPCQG